MIKSYCYRCLWKEKIDCGKCVLKPEEVISGNKPPIGVIPRDKRDELRRRELRDAIARYMQAGEYVDINWVEEYNELMEKEHKNKEDVARLIEMCDEIIAKQNMGKIDKLLDENAKKQHEFFVKSFVGSCLPFRFTFDGEEHLIKITDIDPGTLRVTGEIVKEGEES